MTTNITSADLNQYNSLRVALRDLYNNISAGRISETGVNTFKSCHDNIFPTESVTSYDAALKLTTADANGGTSLTANTISLQKLLINTLYPTFHQTINTNAAPYETYTNVDLPSSANSNKNHLCFIKFKTDKKNIEPDKYPITNILYSKYAIEIFIKINEALMDCYSSHTNDFIANFTSSTKIYIVDKKLKGDHGDNDTKGIYIKRSSSETGADIPPEGIYLYIGNLSNMFQDTDIKMWDSTTQSASVGLSADYKRSVESIFTSSNKLNINNGAVYNFGYLEYSNADDTPKYHLQSGTPETPPVPEATGTMTGVSLAIGTIFSSATINAGSAISGLKIVSGTIVLDNARDPVAAVAPALTGTPGLYTYTIKSGSKISGTIAANSSIKSGAVIRTTPAPTTITLGADDSFTRAGGGSAPHPRVKSGSSRTTIKPNTTLSTTAEITNGAIIEIPTTGYTLMSDVQFTTATKISIMGGSTTYSASDMSITPASAITYPALNIGEYTLASTISTSISGTFLNLEEPSDTPQSFYKQNIYYIYNFIKMIKHIKNQSFSTTSKYLRIYILSYKSLLLASIRAANIFYNNRHKLSAVAISYENDFLNNAPGTSGGTSCALTSLNDFVKNDRIAEFSTISANCTGTEVFPNNTYIRGNGFKYILYKTNAGTEDNDEMFKAYDKRILEELDKLSNTKVKESTSKLGITNFQIFSSFVLKGKFTITSYDRNVHDTLADNGSFKSSAPPTDYKILKDIFYNNKTYDFNKNYRIKIVDSVFKVIKFNTRKDYAGGDRIDIELEHIKDSKDITDDLYKKLNDYNASSSSQQITDPVYIVKITSEDIDKDYNAIVKNTNTIEENINMYKTKIKNNTTLYELHKSRNNLLYNQVLSYLIIVAVIISILVIINVANVEKPLIKSITLACLAVIIILFMSYYIMNTLYIEEGFAEGSGSTHEGYDLCPKDTCKISNADEESNKKLERDPDMQKRKTDFVKNFLEDNAKELMLMIILETPSIVNDSLKGNNEKLVAISKNIYNDKLYLKDVLYSKKSDSEMNVDVLKYENKNYDTYIICVLFLALIMVGSYTINIYTDNKYLDLLILIMVILFVCLFTYFVLYTNRVVRTVSTNYYWGNEYENQYI